MLVMLQLKAMSCKKGMGARAAFPYGMTISTILGN